MISKFALLSNILLATAALAAPSSLVEDPLAHRSEDRQSLAIKGVTPRADNEISEGLGDWAGTIWSPKSHHVSGVQGTFNIPNIHRDFDSLDIAVGIDGPLCRFNGSVSGLFAGISLENCGGRVVGYAWFHQLLFVPGRLPISNFTVAVGDKIEIVIYSPNPTSARVRFFNHRTSQRANVTTRDFQLCQKFAELIVRAPLSPDNRSIQSLAHFDPVTFNNISFNGVPGIPSGARRLDVSQNDVSLTWTNISASRDSLTIRRIQGMRPS